MSTSPDPAQLLEAFQRGYNELATQNGMQAANFVEAMNATYFVTNSTFLVLKAKQGVTEYSMLLINTDNTDNTESYTSQAYRAGRRLALRRIRDAA